MHAQAADKRGTRLYIGRVSVMVLAQVDVPVPLNPHVPCTPWLTVERLPGCMTGATCCGRAITPISGLR